MDENNNGLAPYKEFDEEGYDAVTKAAKELNASATEAIDSFTHDTDDTPRLRNYERYMNEGEWRPADGAQGVGSGNPYVPAVSAVDDGGANGIPEGLEEPMSMGDWLVTMLIMLIPCVNIIMMFVWAFNKNEKKSKSNFFKAELIFMGVIFVLYMILLIVFVAAGFSFMSAFR